MVDMFIIQEGKTVEHLTIDKIMDYYDQIIHLADNFDELDKTEAASL